MKTQTAKPLTKLSPRAFRLLDWKLYSVPDVAFLFGVGNDTVRGWIADDDCILAFTHCVVCPGGRKMNRIAAVMVDDLRAQFRIRKNAKRPGSGGNGSNQRPQGSGPGRDALEVNP